MLRLVLRTQPCSARDKRGWSGRWKPLQAKESLWCGDAFGKHKVRRTSGSGNLHGRLPVGPGKGVEELNSIGPVRLGFEGEDEFVPQQAKALNLRRGVDLGRREIHDQRRGVRRVLA